VYDKHQRKLEDALDQKTAELIALRRAALEHASASPMKVRGGAGGREAGAWRVACAIRR
jgi:kinesin family protein 3/17